METNKIIDHGWTGIFIVELFQFSELLEPKHNLPDEAVIISPGNEEWMAYGSSSKLQLSMPSGLQSYGVSACCSW